MSSNKARRKILKPHAIRFGVMVANEYPDLFVKPVPLAIGIHNELHEAFPEASNSIIRCFLGHWCSRSRYLAVMTNPGVLRWHLDGLHSGLVSASDRLFASEMLKNRLEKQVAEATT